MLDQMMDRPIARIGCFVALLACCIGCYSVYYLKEAMIYPPLLRSLPAPPGIVWETDGIGAGAEIEDYERFYEVEQPYLEVVNFFKEEMPKRGWKLTKEESGIAQSLISNNMLPWTDLVFHGPYFLFFDIQIDVQTEIEQDKQIGTVRVFIYEEPH